MTRFPTTLLLFSFFIATVAFVPMSSSGTESVAGRLEPPTNQVNGEETSTRVLPLLIPASDREVAVPVPFALGPTYNPQSKTDFGLDSISLLVTHGNHSQRFYSVGGEVHFTRLPQSNWREELMKMKAGGLDTVTVYIFWIHHEEIKNDFNFKGRRDVRAFVQLASEVGLFVHLRAGPWDHGDVRNGGSPDWLIQEGKVNGFKLRDMNPFYMAYVSRFFERLGRELESLWWGQVNFALLPKCCDPYCNLRLIGTTI